MRWIKDFIGTKVIEVRVKITSTQTISQIR